MYVDLAPLVPVPGLPLVTKLNIAKPENQEALQSALEKINNATGNSMFIIGACLNYL